jgi:cytochrome c oxidase subunit II
LETPLSEAQNDVNTILNTLLAESAPGGNVLLPIRASTIAGEIDWLTWFITWVCIIFGVGVIVGTIWIALRYRHKPGVNDRGHGSTHNTLLEITWSVIPGIIVLLIAIWGFQGYVRFAVPPPAEAIEIQVEGYKWGWNFTYPNGYSESQLHIPKDVPVRFVMSSRDVIHSLYFPAFRIKKDVVPGRFNKMWVIATETSPLGEGKDWTDPASFPLYDADKPETHAEGFDIYCTEYCGTRHSKMLSKVHVHPTYESWQQWLVAASNLEDRVPDPVVRGQLLSQKNGCFQCHSVDGKSGIGPTWKDLYMHKGKFVDGADYVADEDYIRESILYPNKHIVAGYSPVMPSYLGKISDREVKAIIWYMKSISANYTGTPAELNVPFAPEEKKQ